MCIRDRSTSGRSDAPEENASPPFQPPENADAGRSVAPKAFTRRHLLEETKRNFPRVGISWGPDYREAAFTTLQELLGVERSTLVEPKLSVFDREFDDYYNKIGGFWKEASRRMVRLEKKHGGSKPEAWLNHQISLETVILSLSH